MFLSLPQGLQVRFIKNGCYVTAARSVPYVPHLTTVSKKKECGRTNFYLYNVRISDKRVTRSSLFLVPSNQLHFFNNRFAIGSRIVCPHKIRLFHLRNIVRRWNVKITMNTCASRSAFLMSRKGDE